MNLLAHLHLAYPDDALMLGGVVADFAHNTEIAVLPAEVQAGVRLHRAIDGYTDRHPAVHRSIGRVSARLGWFSGIVIDIYYDYLLAGSFAHYSQASLPEFAAHAYRSLEELHAVAPTNARNFLRRFIDNDYIHQYSTIDGIERTLARVSQRIAERIPRKAVWLPDALPDLRAAHGELAVDFQSFYPQLLAFSREYRATSAMNQIGLRR